MSKEFDGGQIEDQFKTLKQAQGVVKKFEQLYTFN
jgi:hypothetical protein